jgi:ADP-ribose pyrophosphatase YjhB (NUDIX family)
MSDNVCDHKSVGMVVWKDKKMLLVERKKFPFGFAPPAGHVDNDLSFEAAAIRELKEETGLTSTKLQLLTEGRKDTACRREEGTWHYWKIYKMKVEGEIEQNTAETKQLDWYSKKQIQRLARRTRQYLDKRIKDEDWEKNPGIEVVWYEWFQKLKIL